MTRVRLGAAIAACIALIAAVGVGVSAPVPKEKEKTTPFIEWKVKDDFDANHPHDPLVVKDKVIVGTDKGELRAYRCKDGKQAWVHDHGARIYHRPSSDGERVYFSSENGLTAAAIKDGAKVWALARTSCDGPTLALAKHGLVYVGGNDGNLYAVDAKTGKQRWASDFIADAPPDPPGFPGARARVGLTKARPNELVSDGAILFLSVFDQSRVIAVDAATGKRLWSFQTNGWVHGAAAVTEKHIFIGSQDKSFYSLEKKTGKKVWSYETGGRVESGGVVDEKHVYFASCDGLVYCLSQGDGKLLWKAGTDPREGRASAIYSVPRLTSASVIFAAGEGQVYAADRLKGGVRWKIRPSEKSEMYCSPATDGERFFFVTRRRGRGEGEASLVAVGLK